MKVIRNDSEVILYKTNLEEFAGDIYKTKVGSRTLKKLGIAIGYEKLKTNSRARCVYFLIKISPLMRTLLKTMPKSPHKGILKEGVRTRRTLGRKVVLETIVYL